MTQSPSTREPRAAERKRHGDLAVIGLIGGIGGGKSSVASLLEDAGAVVIDADSVGHELLNEPRVCRQLVERFGNGIVSAKNAEAGLKPAIDRKALGCNRIRRYPGAPRSGIDSAPVYANAVSKR